MPHTRPPDPDELTLLRAEEALCAALRARLDAARARGEPNLPSPEAPCFGHLRVRLGDRTRDVLVGERRWPDARPPLLDWRSSPLGALFLSHQEGDDFELELEDATVQGEILARRDWRFAARCLVGVDTPEASFRRQPDGPWAATAPCATHLLPAPPDQPLRQGLLVPDGLLDAGQRRVLDAPAGAALLVEGPAGSGKTTACLRRTAQRCRAGLAPSRALVLVPEAGLAALAERALRALGAGEVPVRTFATWLGDAARTLPDLPAKACQVTPGRVRRFKRHPALLAALPAYVAATGDAAAARLDHALFTRGALLRHWEHSGPGTTLARLVRCERAWRRARPGGHP
ncbi:MAG: DEAD/DEAH box helicase, partial [Pseudomonadota bacterium]